ncbi:MAG: hypothetical protein H6Q07_2304 [Acidobacteria bacterium]|nr:hypothetical protein [Acidobacteriota bacterium]
MGETMTKIATKIAVACVALSLAVVIFARPTVFPTGTTIYKPDKCWNGFTVFSANVTGEITLIDMNGNVVKSWKGISGFPARLFPGGYIMGYIGTRPMHQDSTALVQADWNGNVVWKFDRAEEIKDPDKTPYWSARQHHDYQREGNPVGYYAPGMDPKTSAGNTLVLAHKDVNNPRISNRLLEDDYIYEVTWDGKIVWEWLASDHFDELGLDEAAKNTIFRNPSWNSARGAADWAHINSMSVLGPNRFYDQGDARFHPDNIIVDGRQLNIIWIIEKKTGKVVWKVGPDFTATPELRKLGQIVGQHHAHMIPKGLPGAGNIMVFDNGGAAGYGSPNPGSVNGVGAAIRANSRVLEFNPVTLDLVWQYSPETSGMEMTSFFSHYISSAQRLPNGNTLIDEGADGRIFEVTAKHEIVWEYISPFFSDAKETQNGVYRAYRVPYEWVPQISKPAEKAVVPVPNSKMRVSVP